MILILLMKKIRRPLDNLTINHRRRGTHHIAIRPTRKGRPQMTVNQRRLNRTKTPTQISRHNCMTNKLIRRGMGQTIHRPRLAPIRHSHIRTEIRLTTRLNSRLPISTRTPYHRRILKTTPTHRTHTYRRLLRTRKSGTLLTYLVTARH